jgi:hypothetical protein
MLSTIVLTSLLQTVGQSTTTPATNSYYSNHGYPGFGSIVAKAGDVDGDGVPDFILGDPGQRKAPDLHGERMDEVAPRFWFVSGKTGAVVRSIAPDLQRAYTRSIEGGVDVDGDHVGDLLIATDALESGGASSVYVVSGKDGGVRHKIATCSRSCMWHGAVHFVSDVDRDGVGDFAVLCPLTSATKGSLAIYSGRTGARIKELDVDNASRADLCAFVDVGDIDADGTTDFAVLLGGQSTSAGKTAIELHDFGKEMVASSLCAYSGANGRKLWDTRADPKPCSWNRASLALVATDQVHPSLVYGIDARVELVDAKDGKSLVRLKPGSRDDEGFGYSVSALSDIDHDGITDFVYTIFDTGLYDGRVVACSGRDGKALWKVEHGINDNPDEDIHHLGNEVALIGDIDGDGISDLAVATQKIIDGSTGIAEVISGKDGALLFRFKRVGDDVVVTRRGERSKR